MGTFDISILEVGEGVFEVLSTNGDTQLGGDNIDTILLNYIADEFKASSGVDVRNDAQALQRLKDAAEKAKCDLSNSVQANVNLPFITADASGPKHLNVDISRAKFESLIEPVMKRFSDPCVKAMQDAKINKEDLKTVILVGGTTRIPCVQDLVKNLFGKEPDRSVNPDEAVAVGAAIQGGILAGDVHDIVLLDVTPLSLGIAVMGDICDAIVPRNTTIPTEKKKVYSTASDNQPAVTINIHQGERQRASANKLLGTFNLDGIPPAPRGMPQIEVTYSIDANGILKVSAKDLGTNKVQHITIESSSGLTEEQINKAVEEAKEHEEEDKRLKEKVEARNHAETAIYTTEKALEEHGDKISDDDKTLIKEEIENTRKIIDSEDLEIVKSQTEKLLKSSYKLSEAIYKQQSEPTESAKPEEEVFEAEATVVE